MTAHVLLASSLPAKSTAEVRALGASAAIGIAAGKGSRNPKRWPCEDSVAALTLDDGALVACVADAHWGGSASEVMTRELERVWSAAGPGAPLQKLRRCLLSLDGLLHARPEDDPSETTAILVHRQGKTVTWVGVGDSALYVVSGGWCVPRSKPEGTFLGGRPLAQLPPADHGAVDLGPGELALVATDGLEPDMCMLEPADLVALLTAPGPLDGRVRALLDHQNKVGMDNLGVVLLAG